MTLLFAVIASVAIVTIGVLVHKLLQNSLEIKALQGELKVTTDTLTIVEDKASSNELSSTKIINELRGEVETLKTHASEVEFRSIQEIEETKRAHSLIQMFLEKSEGFESEIQLDRNEARRLFVSS